MSDVPKLRKRQDRRNINIVVDIEVDDIYRLGKQNGWDTSELARQVVTEAFLKNKDKLSRPAS